MNLDLMAQYYDLLHGSLVEDLPMWQQLAQNVPGPILEIGCGTGRLLVPLAQNGHRITGLDLSAVALSAAQARLDALGLNDTTSLVQADMRQFDLPQKDFALALLPLNTLMHCHTTQEQLATLQAICRHLRPGGQLIIDLFHPDPAMLAEADGRLYFETETTDDLTGHLVQWYWRHDIDQARQMRHLTYILDEIDEEGVVRRTQIPLSLRYIYRFEGELLLKATGFTLETAYGSYRLDPFQGHSPRLIFAARKAAYISSR